MEGMLRRDGKYTFYIVEVFLPNLHGEGRGAWVEAGDYQHAKVPQALRFEDARRGKHREPFHQFSACGEVWQKLGIEGSWTQGPAEEMMRVLSQHNKGYRFRISRMSITQERTICAEQIIHDNTAQETRS